MVSRKIRDKRAKAIQTLRDTGMTDEEIEKALGHSIAEEDEIIDVEVVSVEETPQSKGERTPTQAQLTASRPMGMSTDGEEEGQRCQISLPARISPESENASSARRDTGKYTEEWWANAKPEQQQRRCVRIKRNGDRCGQPAINGTTVCRSHGGTAPQIKAAAKARLEMAADRMAAQLLRLGTEAESENVQLSATNSALDRAGITKPTQVELGPMEPKPYEEIMFDAITTETREESRARRAREQGYNTYSPNYGNSAPVDQSPSNSSTHWPAAEERRTEQEQDGSAGNHPDAQSSNPPTQSNGHYADLPSRSDGDGPPHPADQGVRATEGSERTDHQFPKGSTGYDGAGAGAGQPEYRNPWQPSPDTMYTDPESGELMTADERVLYVARRMNEKAGTPPIQAELESPHRRYRAHRRSIY